MARHTGRLKYIPYLYFILAISYWFLDVVWRGGWTSVWILLLAVPFIWHLIKPSAKLSLSLGILFSLISCYLVLAYLSDVFNLTTMTDTAKTFIVVGGLFVLTNLSMSVWILINGLKRAA